MYREGELKKEVLKFLEDTVPIEPEAGPKPARPSPRKNRIRLQIALLTAFACFCLAVLFGGSLGLKIHSGLDDRIPPETTSAITPAAYADQQFLPIGKITSPANNSITDRTVTVTGYTENIPVDTPYIWIMVDVPSIGRAWPKKPVIQPNGAFSISFYEGGPGNKYEVSLYAVGYGLNRLIEQWINDGNFGGLPMIPAQYRLDSVRLLLTGI